MATLAAVVPNDLWRCVLCHGRVVAPRTLDCLHAACLRCLLERITQSGTVLCPQCKHETQAPRAGPAALPVHHVAINQSGSRLASERSLGNSEQDEGCLCDECDPDDQEKAVHFCWTCGTALCDFHKKSHQKTKLTKQHILSEIGADATGQNGNLAVCPKHGRSMSTFCQQCDKLLCADCAGDHETHEIAEVSQELVGSTRDRLHDIYSQRMDESAAKLGEVAGRSAERVQEIDSRAETVSEEVMAFFVKLREKLAKEEAEILKKLAQQQKAITAPLEKAQCEAKAAKTRMLMAKAVADETLNLDGVALLELVGVLKARGQGLLSMTDCLLDVCKPDCATLGAESILTFRPSDTVQTLLKEIESSSIGRVGAVAVDRMVALKCSDGRINIACDMSWIGEAVELCGVVDVSD